MADIKRKVPNLRFKGFTDDWEQRKLGDEYKHIGNAFVGTASPYYTQNGYFYLESNNIKNGQINHDHEVFINESFYHKQLNKLLHTGDLVMVQSGHVGDTAVITEKYNGTAAHALIMFRKPKNNMLSFFLNSFFQSSNAKNRIDGLAIGNTIRHILASDMKKFVVYLPDNKEKGEVAELFLELQKLIALQQRKLDLLKQLKKGFLQKMFAEKNSKQPVVRFKGFHDDWEHRKLGDIALFSKGKGISKKDLQTHGIYNIVHYADVYKFMPVQDKVLHHSNNKMGVRIGSNSLLFAGSDVTPKGLARTTAIKQENVRVGGDVIIADLSEKHLNYFMSYEINMNKRFIYPFITGSTVRHIHGSDLSHLNITFPSLSEQKNIAHIFNLIEHELSLLKIKKSKYQSIKKSLLQQMFI